MLGMQAQTNTNSNVHHKNDSHSNWCDLNSFRHWSQTVEKTNYKFDNQKTAKSSLFGLGETERKTIQTFPSTVETEVETLSEKLFILFNN